MTTSEHESHLDDLAVSALHAHDRAVAETCAECVRNGESFSETAASLATGSSSAPPFHLRQRVLQAAFEARPPSAGFTPPAPPIAAYEEQVQQLDTVLHTLTGDDWQRPAGDWNIHGVVAHLAAVDGLVTRALKTTSSVSADIDAVTNAALAGSEQVGARATFQNWRTQAGDLVAIARTMSMDAPLSFFGLSLTVGQVMVDRAFETWIHTQDVRTALGMAIEAPSVPALCQLTDLGARLLPVAIAGTIASSEHTARLVLTGRGGGSWLVPFHPHATPHEPEVTITMDPIDFCLLIGGRAEPNTVPHEVHGDPDLAVQLITAAPNLSRL